MNYASKKAHINSMCKKTCCAAPAKYKSAKSQIWHAGNFQAPPTPNIAVVQVDILAKVLYFQELPKKSG